MISAVNAYETAIVLRSRRGLEGEAMLWAFLAANEIAVAPFDEDQARGASETFGRFGKGIHSKARLNLADCAAYALAKSLSAPLLFKGDDFVHTDIEQWRWSVTPVSQREIRPPLRSSTRRGKIECGRIFENLLGCEPRVPDLAGR